MQKLNNTGSIIEARNERTGNKTEMLKNSARGFAVGTALAVTFAVSGCATFPGQISEGFLGGYVGSQMYYGEGLPYYGYREAMPYYGYGGVSPYYSYRETVPYYGYGGGIDMPGLVTPYYFGNGYGNNYFREPQQYYRQYDNDRDGRIWQREHRR